MRGDCDEINISSQTVGSAPIQLMPDGTGFKGAGINGQARKGDLKVAQEDFQKVSEQEKSDIEGRIEKAEHVIDKLIGYFDGYGYSTAAACFRRARYIRRWLKWGLISPRASSMVERVMRELGRRLKKIACGWSDKGATKIVRIIFKRFTNTREWEEYWQNKMNCVSNVVINIGSYKCFSQNL